MGVSSFPRNGFCLSGKANLHPLAFYTINVTSPSATRTIGIQSGESEAEENEALKMTDEAEELIRAMDELRKKSRALYEEHEKIVREYERIKKKLQQHSDNDKSETRVRP
jgi:erythromycin esterase-like protein